MEKVDFNGEKIIVLTANTLSDHTLSYNWSLNGNTVCECKTIRLKGNDEGEYVSTVESFKGCNAKASMRLSKIDSSVNNAIPVKPNECFTGKMDIPNAITPNADGHNDNFYVRNESTLQVNLLRVYDRWGELMFSTNDLSQKWDATFRGESCNPGVYVYYLEGFCMDNQPYKKVGNVTIIK